MSQRRYFGTDGIRGRVGEPPMTPDFALKLGWAAGRVLGQGHRPRVLIGKDTRRSGYLFESALEAGLAAAGAEVLLVGPLPTPGIAYLTRELGADAGVVISASHNPHHDNGVKFFDADGSKLSDETELRIEEMLEAPMDCAPPERIGGARRIDDAVQRYAEFCRGSAEGLRLDGMRIVLDCANGACYRVAPMVFRALGADVQTIGTEPDGLNINAGCGSTSTAALVARVRDSGADLGIAFDGDGDRVVMVDAEGQIVDGDRLLYVLAIDRHRAGRLPGPVVGTLMSNLGLEQALAREGIAFRRARVGDRYVLELLRETGGVLGGESSGHLLCLDRCTTGDGIVAALAVLDALQRAGASLSEAIADVQVCPQRMVNVAIRPGTAARILAEPSVQDAVQRAEQELGSAGRVLLRPSGTEPLIRVMVEAVDADMVSRQAEAIADAVREASGRVAA